MTKQEAIEMFGTGAALARALGITRGAISLWPSDLDQARIDRVRGAAMRLGKSLPGDQTKHQKEGAHA
ncbi:Cro/CI family transcriptional regulator [Achromobacter ruhlandii]|uniref:Cro/CI family transcriptional regulator n=1 Tax=Burkholderiales TaxID=80840 RepID=UPI0009F4E3E1|nr:MULTISPECIES: Cro/CI family transcriptional regulator [Achromobacter]MCV6795796.1 Cro/CI family transcriptional regulator [Achromobacter ruhlandii]MCV6802225.1 Cro/CI family transcriptional regulator [Achromobacter ruhlandii]MCV6807768.1 Cro/CI family transcriptional regulator [Achromobacter ruhlandii]MCV6818109.1 Cro/CI family transcriptional regulator [Achromobacter ruhlandii]